MALVIPGGDVDIRLDSITNPAIEALLSAHLQSMRAYSPPERIHALSKAGLADPSVTLWGAWSGGELLGCGALKALDETYGEIKSMRTADAHLRRRVAEALLRRIIREAEARGYSRLSLETGANVALLPAQKLYGKFGFESCGPFGSYVPDPYSVFMSKVL